MKLPIKDSNKGQTLVEILLAVGVAALALMALTRAVTISLRSARYAKNKTLASQHAQETMEALRAYRDQSSWTDFSVEVNCESPPGLPGLSTGFSRIIDCASAGDTVEVLVTISWDAGDYQTKLTTYFTQWQ